MKILNPLRVAAALAAVVGLSMSAHAQDEGSAVDDPVADDEVVETITVTGSRILGVGQSVSPVVTVGQTEFKENPNVQLADFLVENITANNGQLTLTDESNQSGRASGARQTGINLWSLGAENTLTVLNGSRLVNAPAANSAGWFVTDANSIIPGIAMQRVDVLLDGGSAIYGTDAVAGVVNFIPRYGFEGVELRAQTELYPDSLSDTTSYSVSGLWGTKFNDERGSLLVAFDYRETLIQDAEELGLNHANVPQFSGGETAEDFESLLFEGANGYNYSTPPMGMGMSAVPGIPLADPLCGAHDQLATDYFWNGEIMPIGIGATDPDDEGLCAGYPLPDDTGAETDRINIFTAFSYDLTDTAKITAEIGFTDRNISDFYQASTNAGGGFSGATIDPNHPAVLYNNSISADWAAVAGEDIVGVVNEYPFGYERFVKNDADTYNARVGFELDITDRVGMKIGVSHGEAESTQSRHFEHTQRYSDALAGLGGPNCSGTTPGANGCEYYNPFLSAQLTNAEALGLANSQELLDWMIDPVADGTRYFDTQLFAVDATVSVETNWELAGGPIQYVFGAEYREEDASLFYSEAMTQDGVLNGISAGLVPFEGSDSVTGFFTEFLLPFHDTLTVQLAARYDDYDSVGDTTNPKIGVIWQPHDRVTIRGAYGTSFKAPTIVHTSTTVGTASIPTGPTGGRRGGHPVSTIIEGSPDIIPQEATHWSIGGDFVLFEDKGALKNLDISLAYVTFDFDDRIVILQERDRLPSADGAGLCGEVLNNVYTVFYETENNDPNGRPCFEGVDADGSGDLQQTELTVAYRLFTNLALAELDGIDLRLRSAFETGVGDLSFNIGATRTLNYDIQDNPLEPPVSAVGVTGVLGAANVNLPKIQANASLAMDWGQNRAHRTSLTFRYRDEILDDETLERSTGHEQSFDVQHSWNITDDLNVTLTVRNVFENTTHRPNSNAPQLTDGVRSFFLNAGWSYGD